MQTSSLQRPRQQLWSKWNGLIITHLWLIVLFNVGSATTCAFSWMESRPGGHPNEGDRPFLSPPLRVASSGSSSSSLRSVGSEGLSKYHQSILSRMAFDRQRFVSGRYPIVCQVTEPPTLKWLGRGKKDANLAASQVMINGTAVERSLASYDRFQWLDDDERDELHEKCALLSWELLAVIGISKPGYLRILPGHGAGSTSASARCLGATTHRWDRWKRNGPLLEERVCRDRLWVTGFSLAGREGLLHSVDTDTGHIESVNSRTSKSLLWPNEVGPVPAQWLTPTPTHPVKRNTLPINNLKDAVLISDGFLVPGKDRGGIYVVNQPGNPNTEWTVCLTEQRSDDRWFYHRAVWVDLTGDGRKSILTARAKFPLGGGRIAAGQDGIPKKPKCGQLVCLEMPKPYRIDDTTGTPLERDGTVFDPLSSRHLPWTVHVLDEGPDVMFNVVDMDPEDDSVEVIASQFFGEKVTLHSIQRGLRPKMTLKRTIDNKCGKAFGCILADLDRLAEDDASNRRVVDSGSTVETLSEGDTFSHLLVTSHECSFREERKSNANVLGRLKDDSDGATDLVELTMVPADGNRAISKHQSSSSNPTDGGSLFAYRVPTGQGKWKTEEWVRTTVATGFKVQGQLNNMINPGAPGFVYTFHARQQDKYSSYKRRPLIAVAGDCAESAYVFRPTDCTISDDENCGTETVVDPAAKYDLMCEIKCGATVGSIGVGYCDFCEMEQEAGYAKLYIPCYEDDKILVFGLGSGED